MSNISLNELTEDQYDQLTEPEYLALLLYSSYGAYTAEGKCVVYGKAILDVTKLVCNKSFFCTTLSTPRCTNLRLVKKGYIPAITVCTRGEPTITAILRNK